MTEFTLSFFDGVADADFEAVAVGSDGLSVCDFHRDLAGENCFECAVLIEDLEGFAFDFDDTGHGVDTGISIYTKGVLL